MPPARFPWSVEDVRAYFAQPQSVRREHQEKAFLETVHRAWRNIPFFADLWNASGLKPSDIVGLDDLQKLPTTSIHDMRKSIELMPPFGRHWDVTMTDRIGHVLTTGGTTGAPRPVLVTPDCRESIADLGARTFAMCGVGADDVVQVTATYSTHGAAWICEWGLERIGATIVPTSSGAVTPSLRQLDFMRRFGVTAMFCPATYAQILATTARAEGIDPASLGVRVILGAGEVVSAERRAQIESEWGARYYDFYGTMETLAWSSTDCEASREAGGALGSHIWEDALIIEVLDDNGEQCAPGEYGDMTVTSWVSHIGPKVRYRMGDRVAIDTSPCPCGLDTPRMLPVAGRVDDMLRIHNQNIWPSMVEEVISHYAPEAREYVVIAKRNTRGEMLEIQLELDDPSSADPILSRLRDRFKASVGVSPVLVPVEIGATAGMTGAGKELKVRRVFDHRDSQSSPDHRMTGGVASG